MRFALIAIATAGALNAWDPTAVLKSIDDYASKYGEVSQRIWRHAELGFREEKSSALLQQDLREAGFAVTADVAGMPTAFVGTFGHGKPVIVILAEFDALPGLSQDVVAVRRPVQE